MVGPCRVPISLGDRSYDILIGHGLLDDERSWLDLPKGTSALIVTNTTVAPLYAQRLAASLSVRYAKVSVLELPDGEQHKNWSTLNSIFDQLLGEGCDRKTTLFALGGGVVGDMTGFAASCYMRGVPYVQVPTTLLAQVDSSVGGKTGINHPSGKNMIGAFHQPMRVVCDLDTLASLPDREFSAGLAEVIKYGPIADAAFFDWVDERLDRLLERSPEDMAYAVQRACEIKALVISLDERESGQRAILNFGHTFGHAIEAGLGYGTWLHGEAVGCGMVIASELSALLGLVPATLVTRMRQICRRAGLPVVAPAWGVERYLELMSVDKKAEAGQIRFVLIEQIGRAVIRPVDNETVWRALQTCFA